MNSLSSSRFHFDCTICFVISLWIHYHFPEITMKTLVFIAKSVWIHYLLRDFTMNSLNISVIHFDMLSVSRISYKIAIYFAILLWIHFLLREITVNFLSFWIHYLIPDVTMLTLSFSRNHHEFAIFCDFTINSLSASRFYYKFTIGSANSPWIHYLFRDFTIN